MLIEPVRLSYSVLSPGFPVPFQVISHCPDSTTDFNNGRALWALGRARRPSRRRRRTSSSSSRTGSSAFMTGSMPWTGSDALLFELSDGPFGLGDGLSRPGRAQTASGRARRPLDGLDSLGTGSSASSSFISDVTSSSSTSAASPSFPLLSAGTLRRCSLTSCHQEHLRSVLRPMLTPRWTLQVLFFLSQVLLSQECDRTGGGVCWFI